MKVKITAVALMIIIISAVIINTVLLNGSIERHTGLVYEFEISDDFAESEKRAREIYEDFRQSETYISILVNHNDLTNIEDIFAEMIGCLSVGDTDGAKIAKSRLIDALSHLKRLSGVNIDSII